MSTRGTDNMTPPYRDREEKKTRVRLTIGANAFEYEGSEAGVNSEVFKAWLTAASPDTTDVAALVETLKAKGIAIDKFAETLVALAAKVDATAPSEPVPPVTP